MSPGQLVEYVLSCGVEPEALARALRDIDSLIAEHAINRRLAGHSDVAQALAAVQSVFRDVASAADVVVRLSRQLGRVE